MHATFEYALEFNEISFLPYGVWYGALSTKDYVWWVVHWELFGREQLAWID
jgi:hypothetical protein